MTTGRLASPLLESAVPRILDDATHRAAMVDEVMTARVARWPVVNVLDTLLTPVTSIWRQNVGAGRTTELLVNAMTDGGGRSLSASVQATFSLLQQTHPMIGSLFGQQKLWEQVPADESAATLRRLLVGALERQRAAAMERIARRGIFMPLVRWLLTIGAILWFPIVQPVLELFLSGSLVQTTKGFVLLAVQLLLSSAIYFAGRVPRFW